MLERRLGFALLLLMLGTLSCSGQAPSPAGGGPGKDKKASASADNQLVERVLASRKEYQEAMETLRAYYVSAGDIERARLAEDELLQYHRITKNPYRLELDVPPPNLQPLYNIPEANELLRRAITYKDKGWGTDYTDNQRRAELLLQQLLSKHPQSDKISEAAYLLGDLYESRAYRQYARAASYFDRCYQWDPRTHHDARVRAARLYERLGEKNKAIAIYQDVTTHETDPKRFDEAQRKLAELKAGK
jgi:hypothetical protein